MERFLFIGACVLAIGWFGVIPSYGADLILPPFPKSDAIDSVETKSQPEAEPTREPSQIDLRPVASKDPILVTSSTEEKKPVAAMALAGLAGFGLGELYARGQWSTRSTIYCALDTFFVTSLVALGGFLSSKYKGPAQVLEVGVGTGLLIERIKQTIDAKSSADAYNREIRHHIETPHGDDFAARPAFRFPLFQISF